MAKPGSFKPGDPRAIAGGKKSRRTTPDINLARTIVANEFEGLVYAFMDKTLEELEALRKDPSTNMKEQMVAAIMVAAAKNADQGRLEFLLQRTIGKVIERHEIVAKSTHEQIVDQIEADKTKGK
jgi:hypothetical protein